jgi:hypothetical protein
MNGRKAVANRKASSSPQPLRPENLQFSNPNIPLLESHLSHCKQTIALGSNRNFLRGRAFEPEPPPENCIPQPVSFPRAVPAISYPIFGHVTRL